MARPPNREKLLRRIGHNDYQHRQANGLFGVKESMMWYSQPKISLEHRKITDWDVPEGVNSRKTVGGGYV